MRHNDGNEISGGGDASRAISPGIRRDFAEASRPDREVGSPLGPAREIAAGGGLS